jgi:drug/metabolite transporter (DMT)-like permease
VTDRSRDLQFGIVGTITAVSAWGGTSVLVKSIDMDALAIGFWRFLLYSLALGLWMRMRGVVLTRRVMRNSMGGGISLALDVIFFFTAVQHTNIVNATTIVALQPLVVVVFASRMFGERIRPIEIIAAVIAIAATIVIVIESSGTPHWSGWGDVASIGALFAWSAYFIFSKRSKRNLTSQEYTLGTATWTTAALLVCGLAFGEDLSAPPGSEWLPLLGFTIGAGVLGHSIMNWSLVRVPLWIGSTSTVLIPVTAAISAWIFLDESLSVAQIIAMGVVTLALGVTIVKHESPDSVEPTLVASTSS